GERTDALVEPAAWAPGPVSGHRDRGEGLVAARTGRGRGRGRDRVRCRGRCGRARRRRRGGRGRGLGQLALDLLPQAGRELEGGRWWIECLELVERGQRQVGPAGARQDDGEERV